MRCAQEDDSAAAHRDGRPQCPVELRFAARRLINYQQAHRTKAADGALRSGQREDAAAALGCQPRDIAWPGDPFGELDDDD
jgi:hypothetical protein